MFAQDRRRRWFALMGAVAFAIFPASLVVAAPGDLDPTFDGDGKVTTHFVYDDGARGVAVQPDGKIVAAGYAICTPCAPPFTPHDLVLARYNPDGALDSSFGNGGRTRADFGAPADEAFAVVLQSDGKIVAAGFAGRNNDPTSGDFALARFLSNGTLDPTFDGDGMVTTDFVGNADEAHAVAIQPDGKIVATGFARAVGTDFALARYLPNGLLDPTFDGDGKVTVSGLVSTDNRANGLVIQPDGKIVAAGCASCFSSDADFALVRYNPGGSLDASFGGDGSVTTDFDGSEDAANGLALQADGKLVAAGLATVGLRVFGLARYAADGSLDPTFDGDGEVATAMGNGSEARGVAIQRDGKIVAAGVACVDCLPGSDFGLARYRVDGSLDPTFSEDGRVFTDFGFADDQANAVALQADGKIVAAGVAGQDFALARYKVCRVSSRRSSIPCR
jgi:uncharacterized delta-60 repeat protein